MSDLLSEEQLKTLRTEYARIERIDPCGAVYPKMCAFLDALPDARLVQLATAGIKFLSMLARNRAMKRRLLP